MRNKLVLMMAMLLTSNAFAAFKFAELLKESKANSVITIGFGLAALSQVIKYIQNFDLGSAVQKAIAPAISIFMFFKWESVFKWIGLN